ncbi:hypothetical protein [Profundibacter sp.]
MRVFKFVSFALLALTLLFTSASTVSALDRRVRIVNDTDYAIIRFYGSNKGSDSWEEDILGDDILASGDSIVIDFDDGSGYCKFDFKAEFDDGDVLEKRNVNVCKIGTFTYN